MRWWDESMFAVNTYEMLHNGNCFSLYYEGLPDLYNTKPPLTSWLQAIFVKILGFNETAIRLPSALAAGISVLALFNFVKSKFNVIWAWSSSLVLLTSYGFLHFHTGRTGDSDSVLTLFLLLANLSFIRFVLGENKKQILYFFLFLLLAFLTKLHASLLFAPAYVAVLLYKNQFRKFVFNWQFLTGVFLFVVIIFSLFWLREVDTPGYLNKLFNGESGRLTSAVDYHKQPLFFYLDNLFRVRFSTWFTLAVIGILVALFSKKSNEKDLLLTLTFLALVYLAVIMISITKLEWYDLPLYPYLALLAGFVIYKLTDLVNDNSQWKSSFNSYVILAGIFAYPYVITFEKSQANNIREGEMKLESKEAFIYQQIKENRSLDNIKVLHNNWNGSLLFYKYKLVEIGQKIELCKSVNELSIGDTVLVSEEELKNELKITYSLDLVDAEKGAELFLLSYRVVN